MKKWVALLALGLLLAATATASARTPSTRTEGQRSTGARTDITVPYLNHGTNAFQGYSVGVRIYSSPIVDDPKNPQAKKVYNLPFYGAAQSFGDKSNGATPKPK